MGIEYDVIKLQHDVANLARYLEEHCKSHPESVKVAELPKIEPVLTIDQCAVGMELIATDNVDLTIWIITKVSPLWIKSPHGNPFFIPSERIGEFRIHRPKLTPEDCLGRKIRCESQKAGWHIRLKERCPIGSVHQGYHLTKDRTLWVSNEGDQFFLYPKEIAEHFSLVEDEAEKPYTKGTDPEAYARKWAEEHGLKICEPDEIPVKRKWFNELTEELDETKDSIKWLVNNA
jgi:hypothetical protein